MFVWHSTNEYYCWSNVGNVVFATNWYLITKILTKNYGLLKKKLVTYKTSKQGTNLIDGRLFS